jgi:hypothetical protein
MSVQFQTSPLVAALYLSRYLTEDFTRLRDQAARNVDAVVVELAPMLDAVITAPGGTLWAGRRLDPTRLTECDRTATVILDALPVLGEPGRTLLVDLT